MIASNDKGKGIFYEEFLPINSLVGNIHHPQSRTTDETRTHASTEDTTQARVMTDQELLISLHHKFDRNHNWVKRHFSEILSYMAHTHSSVKKVHQYAHHTYQHLDALMKEVITPEDLANLNLQPPPIPAIRPPM